MLKILLATSFAFCFSLNAAELEFKYDHKKKRCLNKDGKWGINKDHFGECGEIRGKDLKQKKYENIDLKGARIMSVDFEGSTFKNVKFDLASVTDTSFRNTKLTEVTFRQARLYKLDLSGAVLTKVWLSVHSLNHSIVRKAKFIDSNFEAELIKTIIEESTFEKGTRIRLNVGFGSKVKTNLFRGTAPKPGERNSRLYLAFITGSRPGEISRNVFQYAHMLNSDLRGGIFTENTLQHVSFGSVNATGANLSGNNFTDVSFSHSNFTRADMSGVLYNKETAKKFGNAVFHQTLFDERSSFDKHRLESIKRGMIKRPY